jgi:hypothetical protein
MQTHSDGAETEPVQPEFKVACNNASLTVRTLFEVYLLL